jgi:hypothetical protein
MLPQIMYQTLRPLLPPPSSAFPLSLQELMKRCWAQKATERPAAKEVLDSLDAVMHELTLASGTAH